MSLLLSASDSVSVFISITFSSFSTTESFLYDWSFLSVSPFLWEEDFYVFQLIGTEVSFVKDNVDKLLNTLVPADGRRNSFCLLWFYFGRSHVHFILMESVKDATLEVANWQKVYYVPKCFFYMSVPVAKLVGASCSHSPTANFPYENHLPGGPWVTSSRVQVGLGSLDFLLPVLINPCFHESRFTVVIPQCFETWNHG